MKFLFSHAKLKRISLKKLRATSGMFNVGTFA
jgi:hypothetical protein